MLEIGAYRPMALAATPYQGTPPHPLSLSCPGQQMVFRRRQRSLLNFIGIYTLLVVGLNLLLGYAGQISLGHAAFFGLGAYTSGILTATYGVNPWLALVAGLVVSGSFPALAVSALAALTVLDMEVLMMSSLGASSYGANQPGASWIDMENWLIRRGGLRYCSALVSAGGRSE